MLSASIFLYMKQSLFWKCIIIRFTTPKQRTNTLPFSREWQDLLMSIFNLHCAKCLVLTKSFMHLIQTEQNYRNFKI